MRTRCLTILWLVLWTMPLMAAETLKTAVAANFIAPFQEISQQYEAQTGVKVEATFSSSGKIYAQIVNGAPYDLFLSADEERPQKLAAQGLALPPFVYAKGQVVLWTARSDLCALKDWQGLVKRPDIAKVAVANPETAPYGAAAKQALVQAGLWEALSPRLVFPQDIAQAFQYASTGAVDAGFCARSATLTEAGQRGCYLPVPQAPAIIQAACVLTTTPHKDQATAFAAYLRSREARAIIARYGYALD